MSLFLRYTLFADQLKQLFNTWDHRIEIQSTFINPKKSTLVLTNDYLFIQIVHVINRKLSSVEISSQKSPESQFELTVSQGVGKRVD